MRTVIYLFASLLIITSCNNNQPSTTTVAENKDTIKQEVNAPVEKTETTQNGESIERYANGVIKMQGAMKDGKRDGLWKSFYESGSPWSETTFSNGLKNGRTTTWYDNEKKRYDGFYTNDIESGKWTFWDEKGKMTSQKDYDKK